MPEDEYDFEGLNPAMLLPLERDTQSFDYEAELHHKGYTSQKPFDLSALFKDLGTEYIPRIVVDLPPRVIERIRFVSPPLLDRLKEGLIGDSPYITIVVVPFLACIPPIWAYSSFLCAVLTVGMCVTLLVVLAAACWRLSTVSWKRAERTLPLGFLIAGGVCLAVYLLGFVESLPGREIVMIVGIVFMIQYLMFSIMLLALFWSYWFVN